MAPVLTGQRPLFCELAHTAWRSKSAEKLCNPEALGSVLIIDSFNRRFIVILLSRGVRSSKMLETFHQTTRRHLNIHFCEDFHCSFLLRRDMFRGRQIMKESGWLQFRWLLVQVGVGFGLVWNVSRMQLRI